MLSPYGSVPGLVSSIVKIANLTHPFFIRLKYNVPRWVPRMLFSSVGLSSLNSILSFIGNLIIYQDYLRSNWQSWNVTGNSLGLSFEKFNFFLPKMIMWTMPFAVFLIFMVLLLTSLGRHMKKTLLTISGFQGSPLLSHGRALLVLFSFFILFTSSFLSLVLSSVGTFPVQELGFWMWQVVIHLCIAVHSVILLFSNPMLREMLERGCSSR